MKNFLSRAAILAFVSSSALVTGFSCYSNRNGQDYFAPGTGRFRRRSGQRQPEKVEKMFEELKQELNDNDDPYKPFPFDDDGFFQSGTPENRRRQKQWINKAIDFAQGLNQDFTSSAKEAQKNEENMQQFRDLINDFYGMDDGSDSSSSGSSEQKASSKTPTTITSPRFEIRNTDKVFEVALDMPGVVKEDVDVSLENEGKILKIEGTRVIPFSEGAADIQEEVTIISSGDNGNVTDNNPSPSTDSSSPSMPSIEKFSKKLFLPDDVDTERITAKLVNGVLFVAASKKHPKEPEGVVRIPIE